MHARLRTRRSAATVVLLLAATVLALGPGPAGATNGGPGAVYTLSNASGGNAVMVFARDTDGTLAFSGSFPTTGLGSGGGLGDQGALVMKGGRLFAVDAGSNEITSFAVSADGLTLTHLDTASSGGVLPISMTVKGDLMYVLNAGDASHASTIVGFRLRAGTLHVIAGSTRPLSAASPGPAQIQFSPNGKLLFVTEKDTNLIDTFTVGGDGLASGPTTHPSSGPTPFGFAVRDNRLFVSEAFGGAPGASAMSSYAVGPGGSLTVVSGSVPTTQTAACWVVITRYGKYAYTTNTGSASISSYRVHADGRIRLLEAVAGGTGAGPIDMALSRGSHFLYSLDSGAHGISGFEVGGDGSLASIGGPSGLPASAVGLAAR